jgi:hypothetical protein
VHLFWGVFTKERSFPDQVVDDASLGRGYVQVIDRRLSDIARVLMKRTRQGERHSSRTPFF